LRWHGGGVAFLDTSCALTSDLADSEGAFVRCYNITLQQFNDVVDQENGDALPDPVDETTLGDLVARGPGSSVTAAGRLPTGSWYGHLVYLGDSTEGTPILTFTCHPEDHLTHPFNEPSVPYSSVIFAGLVEAGKSKVEASTYLKSKGVTHSLADLEHFCALNGLFSQTRSSAVR
jgi:hypothetical protein